MPLRTIPCGSDCPCEECDIRLDDFTTDPSGSGMTVGAGTWSHSSGVLSTSSTNARILIDKAGSPVGVGTRFFFRVEDCQSSASGDKLRCVTNWVDASNYRYVEVEIGSTNSTLRAFSVVSGTPSQNGSDQNIVGLSPDETFNVDVCFAATILICYVRIGSVNAATFTLSGLPTLLSGKCGLATGTLTGTAQFSAVRLAKHQAEDSECPHCDCFLCFDPMTRTDTTNDTAALGECLTAYGTIDADISSNMLVISGTDSGVVGINSAKYLAMAAIINTPSHTGSDITKVRFVFGFVDEDNHGYWEMECFATNKSKLTCGVRANGTDTVVKEKFWRTSTSLPNDYNVDSIPTTFSILYDQETGYAYLSTTLQLSVTTDYCGWHQFGSDKPTGTKMGIGYGDTQDHSISIDSIRFYSPILASSSDCPPVRLESGQHSTLGSPTWNSICRSPPEEIAIDLTGITNTGPSGSCGSGTSLNATYILQRIDENDHTLIPRRSNSPNLWYGGMVYRYTFPSAICGIERLDFWLAGQERTQGGTSPLVRLAGGSTLINFTFTSFNWSDCSIDNTSGNGLYAEFTGGTIGVGSATARVYIP